MAFSFFGGVHPKEHKQLTRECPITPFPEPELVVIPMLQHIGAKCTPLVKKGDAVTVGQKLGDGEGLCVPVHASVSGTVRVVEQRAHTGGVTNISVVIENDHLGTLCPDIQPRSREQVEALSAGQLLEIIREKGIVGMGGAAFPTHVKLSSGIGKVDTVIVNAGECEPYITADDRLCREQPEQILSGLQIILKILGLSTGHIAIEDNKPEAATALKQAAQGTGITVDVLPAKYPQGAEKQLVYAVTGRRIPSGALPSAVGCAVFNVASCKAIYDGVYDDLPLIRRVVTLTGDIVTRPGNYLVPIGTSIQRLLEAAEVSEPPYKILSGGPMMGATQYDLAAPVIKGTNAITILGPKNRSHRPNPHCIRCGRCLEVCPMGLMPTQLYRAYAHKDTEALKAEHLSDCIECGCCAYTCPAGLPLVQSFRAAKQLLRK